MLTKQQLMTMLELQDSMNKKVNPDWINEGNDWMLAAMMEASEAIDHHGWKWWKKQEPDMAQLQMELVDIWHFALSNTIETCDGDLKRALAIFTKSCSADNPVVRFDHDFFIPDDQSLLDNLKLLVGITASGRFNVNTFFTILEQTGMTTDDLYKQYVGKNVLNFFRQDNGYKDGTYIKVWDGKEDNEVLSEILVTADTTADNFSDQLYTALSNRYQSLSH